MLQGDVSSSVWSLAIEADNDGLVVGAPGAGEEEEGAAGVASDYLVLAEADAAVEDGENALSAVSWTASGVVVLVFVGAVVVWM